MRLLNGPNLFMEDKTTVNIEIIYITPENQSIIELEVKKGCTIKTAIMQSGLLARYSEIDLAINKVGVFGKIRSLNDTLATGDRVEIYRPLLLDPKEMRRRRAAKNKA